MPARPPQAAEPPVQISPSAKDYLRSLLDQKEAAMGIRIFVVDGGTPKAETCISYCRPEDAKADDLKFDLTSFALWIEATSEPYLKEAEVDYNEDALGGQLTIRAPAARMPKLGPKSSRQDQVNYFLWNEVNPMLAQHGGAVELVAIEKKGRVVMRFGGGCQGCSMVDVTLKSGIEDNLKNKFDWIKEVVDVTDHSFTDNAYYS